MKACLFFLVITCFEFVYANDVFKAVSSGNLDLLRHLSNMGHDLHKSEWVIERNTITRITPLSKAIEIRRPDIVEFLLENGVSPCSNGVDIRDRDFEPLYASSILEEAIDSNDLQILILLMKHGANPNEMFGHRIRDSFHTRTALTACTNIGQRLVLLSYGVNPEGNDDNYLPIPLEEAILNGDYFTAIVYLLWNSHSHPPIATMSELNDTLVHFPLLQAFSILTIFQEGLPTFCLPGKLQRIFEKLNWM